MKDVIYAWYSPDNPSEESIEGQLRECIEFAKYNDSSIFPQLEFQLCEKEREIDNIVSAFSKVLLHKH